MSIEKAIAEILESWPEGDDKFTQGICQGLRAAIVILQKQAVLGEFFEYEKES